MPWDYDVPNLVGKTIRSAKMDSDIYPSDLLLQFMDGSTMQVTATRDDFEIVQEENIPKSFDDLVLNQQYFTVNDANEFIFVGIELHREPACALFRLVNSTGVTRFFPEELQNLRRKCAA